MVRSRENPLCRTVNRLKEGQLTEALSPSVEEKVPGRKPNNSYWAHKTTRCQVMAVSSQVDDSGEKLGIRRVHHVQQEVFVFGSILIVSI